MPEEHASYWYNPKNWGVEDYDEEDSFDKAYKSAKKDGKKEFLYRGKRYNTKYKGTPNQEFKAYGANGKKKDEGYRDYTDTDVEYYNIGSNFSKNGGFLPGHISSNRHETGVNAVENPAAIDARPGKTFTSGDSEVEPSATYRIYGRSYDDQLKWFDKYDEALEDGTDWDLFTNNCADGQCDAFNLKRSEGLETPANTLKKMQDRYAVMDVSGRTSKDYKETMDRDISDSKEMFKNAQNMLPLFTDNREFGAANGKDLRKKYIQTLQKNLADKGYDMSSSLKKDGTYDGVAGKDTKDALKEYNTKDINKYPGGVNMKRYGKGVANPPPDPKKNLEYEAMSKVLNYRNRGQNFIQRANDPDRKVIKNNDGTVSTHRMAYTDIGKEGFLVYPTIIEGDKPVPQKRGELKQLSGQEAVRHAFKNQAGVLVAGAELAEYYSSQGYKNEDMKKYKKGMKSDSPPKYMGGLAAAGSIMGGVGGLTSLFGGLSGDADVAKTGATIGMAGSALGTVGTAFDERKAKKEMEGTMPVAENPTEEEMDTSQTPVSDMQQGAPELQLTDEQRAMYQQRNNELYGTFRDGINTNGARGLMAKYGCYMKPGRKANGRAK